MILDELKTKTINGEFEFLAVEDNAWLQGRDDLRKDNFQFRVFPMNRDK